MTDVIVKEEDDILWVSINRRAKANSISKAVTEAYIDAAKRVANEPHLKGLVWTSESSDLFSGGVDLSIPEGFSDQQASEWRTALIVDLLHATLECPRPIVVMARGRMLGGAFLNAILCDKIVAAESATFMLPEVKIGIGSPVAASVVESVTHAGLAFDLLLSAREIPAAELQQKGGPCLTVPDDKLREETIKMVNTLGNMPPQAYGYMKKWFQAPRRKALDEAIAHTAATRRDLNDEVSSMVKTFFKKD